MKIVELSSTYYGHILATCDDIIFSISLPSTLRSCTLISFSKTSKFQDEDCGVFFFLIRKDRGLERYLIWLCFYYM